jgi:transposase
MRLILQKIYEIADAKLARRKLHAWCRWVRWVAGRSAPVLFAAVVKTAKMIERHLEGVMARPMNRITNVFLEGRNSIFSAVKRKAAVFVRPRVLPQCFASPPGASICLQPTENSEELKYKK